MKKAILILAIVVLLYSLVFPILYFFPSLNASILTFFFYLSSPLFAFIIIVGTLASIYFLIMSLTKKRKITSISRTSYYLFLLSFIVFPITYTFPKPLPTGSFDLTFSETLWKKSELVSDSLQITYLQKMLGDLINIVLPGKSEAEIIKLLGEPEFRDIKNYKIIYELGAERDTFIRIDFEWLEIVLDEKGIYKKSIVSVD